MSFGVKVIPRNAAGGLPGEFYQLQKDDKSAGAEVWPAFGFNCVRWFTAVNGVRMDWLYSAPDLLENLQPTRSGIPVLFPFPNRIRAGRFSWDGKDYELPLNDPAGKNAIHGFACRHPWRVIDFGGDEYHSWIMGEFHAARDALETLNLWPADYRLRITYRLFSQRLRIEAEVDNPDRSPLPFGLGFHPYFRIAEEGRACLVTVPAAQIWRLQDQLPNGERYSVDAGTDLRPPRRIADLQLDHAFTELDRSATSDLENMFLLAELRDEVIAAQLEIRASSDFREIVVFTPPHRQAVCLEPYSCVTDAVNLQQSGVDAGLQILQPGKRWSAAVELVGVHALA